MSLESKGHKADGSEKRYLVRQCYFEKLPWFQNVLTFALGFVPPLFVWPGKLFNHYAFTLYREPKLYLIGALAWLLFTVGNPRKSAVALWISLMGLLALFSSLWALVKEAVIYEVFQYVNLIAVSLALVQYFRQKEGRSIFLYGLILGMAVAVSIGLCQWLGLSFPMLKPVGIAYPSTFGARHSAALAVCGSMFLTLIPTFHFITKKRYISSLFFILIFTAEILYVFILGSRTAYLGLLIGGIAGPLLWIRQFGIKLKKLIIFCLVVLLLGISAYSLAIKNDYVRERLEKTFSFFKKPSAFFQTERWIWWNNSFQMLKDNPFGVGAGNWGFLYPVYRVSGKHVYFTDQTQVRRTHNDYLQILCELGPSGLAIFLLLLFKGIQYSWRAYYHHSSNEGFLLLVQLLSWIGLLCFDYPFEMPFQRFLLIVALLLSEGNYNEVLG